MKAPTLIGVLAAASVIAIALTVQPADGLLSYGDFCNASTEACNDQVGLSCQTGSKCGCQMTNLTYSSFWDSGAKTCFLTTHPQVPCNPVADSGAPAIPCTQNSKCRRNETASSYKCFCDYPFVTSESMFYKCYAPYGANCSDAECVDGQGLICGSDKSCKCRQGTHYDTTNGCIIKIGDTCGLPGEALGCADSDRSTCTNNKCECKTGFEPTADMLRCVKKPGDACAKDEECPDTFTCNNVTTTATAQHDDMALDATVTALVCSCKAGEIHVNGSNVCRVKAGSACETSSGNSCVQNAACSTNKTCECNSGYKNASTGLCKGMWSSLCADNADCAEDDFLECNAAKRCECKTDYRVNSSNKVCVGTLGSKCNKDDNCQATGATCSNSLCACASNYRADNGTCFGYYGAACTVDLPCFKPSLLRCTTNSVCGCDWASENWDTSNSNNATCAIKPMGRCGSNYDRPCTTNSTCTTNENEDMLCMCEDGMEPNGNFTACINSAAAMQLFRVLFLLPLYVVIKFW